MSADIYVTFADGTNMDVNYTYNLTSMHRAALEGVALHTNRPDPELFLLRLKTLVHQFDRDPDRFRALNPANGWGDYDTHLRQLRSLLLLCDLKGVGNVEYCL